MNDGGRVEERRRDESSGSGLHSWIERMSDRNGGGSECRALDVASEEERAEELYQCCEVAT